MTLNLKELSTKELEKLLADVKKALTNAKAKDRRAALKAAEKAAAEFGFSLSDLSKEEGKPKSKKRAKAKAAAKPSKPQFANPDDPKQTWTGKGRQPNWFRAAVEKGMMPDAMRIGG